MLTLIWRIAAIEIRQEVVNTNFLFVFQLRVLWDKDVANVYWFIVADTSWLCLRPLPVLDRLGNRRCVTTSLYKNDSQQLFARAAMNHLLEVWWALRMISIHSGAISMSSLKSTSALFNS